eukprot:scaffold458359_cov17-Prasinocladus_malaysianus.AAC.1
MPLVLLAGLPTRTYVISLVQLGRPTFLHSSRLLPSAPDLLKCPANRPYRHLPTLKLYVLTDR